MKQKHILAIHDISCIGRCSLTVALPVISAAGITTSVLPTAVLSTQTGGISGYTYRDLTADMPDIADHWQSLSISFDAIYTGYLGSWKQLEIVEDLSRQFKTENTLMIVDPVMADGGELYPGFSPDFPNGMAKLCKCADVITPNMTEALLMVKESYHEGPYSQDYINDLLKALSSKLNVNNIVLTGVYLDENKYGAAAYDNGNVHFSFSKKISGDYHGTGDVFSSVLTAAIVKGNPLSQAMSIAVKFTSESIKRTYLAKTDTRYGVNFEAGLKDLAGMLDLNS